MRRLQHVDPTAFINFNNEKIIVNSSWFYYEYKRLVSNNAYSGATVTLIP